jgi:hypothetical protein
MSEQQKQERINELRAQLDPLTLYAAIRFESERGERGRALLRELQELEGDQ